MRIPAEIIHLAIKNARLSKTQVNIYKYHGIFVTMPDGYAVPVGAVFLGYVTAGGVYYETAEERSIASD